jgi:hypothetical protein
MLLRNDQIGWFGSNAVDLCPWFKTLAGTQSFLVVLLIRSRQVVGSSLNYAMDVSFLNLFCSAFMSSYQLLLCGLDTSRFPAAYHLAASTVVADMCRITWYLFPQDINHHNHHFERIISHMLLMFEVMHVKYKNSKCFLIVMLDANLVLLADFT